MWAARLLPFACCVVLGFAGPDDGPSTLTDCLLTASDAAGCAEVAGCIWCKEPLSGLCVTEAAARRMNALPFFDCGVDAAFPAKEEGR